MINSSDRVRMPQLAKTITMSVSPARSGKNLRFFPVLSSRSRIKNTMAAEIR